MISDAEWSRKVTRAEELARRSNLTKGFATFTQPGVAAHNAVEELTAKHPYAPPPSADHRDGKRWEEESPPFQPSGVKRAIIESASAGAADRFGWCIREDLIRKEFQSENFLAMKVFKKSPYYTA